MDALAGRPARPLGHEAGKRYPLVIQTHGFDPNSFLLDGPFSSTGRLCRTGAGREGDQLVLQLQDAPPPYGTPDEPVTVMKGVKAAIKALDDGGLIDLKRMGIHGFSRTSLVVQEALVNSASISPLRPSPMPFAWRAQLICGGFGGGYPAMMDTEWLMGVPHGRRKCAPVGRT